MKISVCVNCDTRPENNTFGGSNLTGISNEDLLVDGVINKIKFFDGFKIEVILFVDLHNPLPIEIYEKLKPLVDVLVIRKHTDEPNFNDHNYISALQLASGDIIFHIDQDCAVFSYSKEDVEDLIKMLDYCDYVSYPSHWTPRPVVDDSFDHIWVSTRFFLCKRTTLNFTEIIKCLNDYDYWCETYPVNRKCHWLEHLLGSISKYKGDGVYYPAIEMDKHLIFCWSNYKKGTLEKLNSMSYEEVKGFVNQNNGIQYPNDLYIK